MVQAFSAQGIASTLICRGDISAAGFAGETCFEAWDWLTERERLADCLAQNNLVFVDSYEAPRPFYIQLSRIVPLCVYFDDNRRMRYPKGIIINAAAGAEELKYPNTRGVQYLLGCRYIPMRKVFWNVPPRHIRQDIQALLLMLGGCDRDGLTPRLQKFLADLRPRTKIIVVSGPGSARLRGIKRAPARGMTFMENPDPSDLRKAMLAVDVAVSSAGQTLYELARTGTPTIAISIAANQKTNVRGLRQAGFIEYAGPGTSSRMLSRIEQALRILDAAAVRRKRARIGQALVAGNGALQIVDAVMKSYFKCRLELRLLEEKDLGGLLRLSNQPEVRESSFCQEKILWKDHLEWFRKKSTDPKSLCLVAEIQEALIGQVRFDVREESAWISISISRDFRRCGLGKDILKQGIVHLRQAFPGVRTVIAQIRKENRASIRFFENYGFWYGSDAWILGQSAVEYRLAL